ncbi:hypothetical protein Goshw_008982 [Gossypium schwendimanii]|uniref:RNase H type-1 domain-containing protein n=1 Tax=Gossypium schwendimanii TaxID=34291 RepID=A0A7J9KWT7_GOSSC|nr:hypothetical protein [Gossypium schwendimanii]
MGSCVYSVKNVRDLTTADAYACLQGVVFAEEMGFDEVIVEVDSMIVIKKLQSLENDRSLIVVIINEIKEKTRRLRSIRFRYILLRANEAAYVGGEDARSGEERGFVTGSPRNSKIKGTRGRK